MSRALSFAEIDGQHVELLPARTVLSLFSAGGDGSNTVVGGNNCQQFQPAGLGLVQAIGLGAGPQLTQECLNPPVAATTN
ncbi:MAG TPA: hypothetical protein VF003_05405 [Pseudonocardiaceae bacterium]|jgi:hypothetical protein